MQRGHTIHGHRLTNVGMAPRRGLWPNTTVGVLLHLLDRQFTSLVCSKWAILVRNRATCWLPGLGQGQSGKHKADPFFRRSRVRFRVPPAFRTQLHVTTSLGTGGGPVSYVQLSEGVLHVVYPLSLWSRFSGVVKVQFGYGL